VTPGSDARFIVVRKPGQRRYLYQIAIGPATSRFGSHLVALPAESLLGDSCRSHRNQSNLRNNQSLCFTGKQRGWMSQPLSYCWIISNGRRGETTKRKIPVLPLWTNQFHCNPLRASPPSQANSPIMSKRFSDRIARKFTIADMSLASFVTIERLNCFPMESPFSIGLSKPRSW
jgi:hypothetical protein